MQAAKFNSLDEAPLHNSAGMKHCYSRNLGQKLVLNYTSLVTLNDFRDKPVMERVTQTSMLDQISASRSPLNEVEMWHNPYKDPWLSNFSTFIYPVTFCCTRLKEQIVPDFFLVFVVYRL